MAPLLWRPHRCPEAPTPPGKLPRCFPGIMLVAGPGQQDLSCTCLLRLVDGSLAEQRGRPPTSEPRRACELFCPADATGQHSARAGTAFHGTVTEFLPLPHLPDSCLRQSSSSLSLANVKEIAAGVTRKANLDFGGITLSPNVITLVITFAISRP